MAIYGAVPPPPQLGGPPPPSQPLAAAMAPPPTTSTSSAVPAVGIDIEAWTIQALQSLSVSPVARGTGTPLGIPLDGDPERGAAAGRKKPVPDAAGNGRATTPIPRPPSARDSQRKREMLQKGKEGSRQRRRWENDRLVGVPNAQPPLPADWEARPTHPVQHVPYHVAAYWDRGGVRDRVADRAAALQAARKARQLQQGSATGIGRGEVPRDLRESAKRRPAVRGWVRVLEEPVRRFLVEMLGGEAAAAEDDEKDEEDEEIVFVGRAVAREVRYWVEARREIGGQGVDKGIVFDSLGDDEAAAFRRWLTHSISDYYGLESRSVTMGDPARRVVYVGVKPASRGAGRSELPTWAKLPRPLWEVC